MTRTLRSAAAVLLALASAAGAAAAQSIPAGTGGQLSSLPGLAFDVPLVVDMSARSERLGSFAARLTWDPARLRLDATTSGSFGSVTSAMDSVAQGVVRLAGANPAGGAGQVTIGLLRFTPLINDTSSINLSFSELYAAGTFADLRPSMTVSGGQFCPARGRYGDMDLDGTANSRDALIALSAAVGINVAPNDTLLGDVDASGITNARDALGILTHAVGLPTPGFRVLAMALGSCATAGPITFGIAPGVIGTMVVGQFLQLEARASDGAGALQAVPDAIWRTSDANIAVVGPNGVVTARGPGTVLITALRAGQDSAGLSLTVAAGRTRHFVDASALQASNAIGTAAVPFGRLSDAIRMARDGDTIQMRVGRYEPSTVPVTVPRLVIIGDTTLSGQRPVIAGLGSGAGLALAGTQNVSLGDLQFEDLGTGVDISGGAGRVELVRARSQNVASVVTLTGPLGHLRVDRGRFMGNTAAFSPAAFDLAGPTDTLSIVDTDISDFGGSAVEAPDIDSVSVRRSRIHSMFGEGFNLDNLEARNRGMALSVDSTTIRNTLDELLDAEDVRSVVVRWSTLENRFDDLMNIASADGSGYVKLLSDSLLGEDMYWIDAEGLDSVVVDSVQGKAPDAYNYMYNIGLVRIRDSRFDGFYYVIDADLGGASFNRTAGRVDVRNTQMLGPSDCDRCGSGIQVDDNIGVYVDSVLFFNLSYAIEAYSDSNVTVLRSRFEHLYEGIEVEGNYSVGCPSCGNPAMTLFVQQSTFIDTYRAIEVDDALLVADSNTFDGSDDEAIEVDTYGPMTVTRNRFNNIGYGIDFFMSDSSASALLTDNVFTNVYYSAISGDGNMGVNDSLDIRFEIRRNTISCDPEDDSEGIYASGALVFATDNVLTGCYYAMRIRNFNGTPLQDSILRNRVTGLSNNEGGIIVEGNLRSVVRGNHVTVDTLGGGSYALLYVYGYGYAGSSTLIEHDTLVGGQSGLYASALDTVTIRYNVLEGGAHFNSNASIRIEGGVNGDTVRVRGNQIRRADIGIAVHNDQPTPVLVDSNVISKSFYIGVSTSFSGNFLLRRNAIDSSGQYGVLANSAPVVMDSNNIQGSGLYGLLDAVSVVDARFNWWGDAQGPRCISGCSGTSAGDSVLSSNFTPFLTVPYGGAPPFGVRRPDMVASMAAPLAAPLAARSGPATARVRRPRPAIRPERVPATAPSQPAPAVAPEFAARASRVSASRATEESRRQQRRAERRQEHDRERAAREQADLEADAAGARRRAERPSAPVRRP